MKVEHKDDTLTISLDGDNVMVSLQCPWCSAMNIRVWRDQKFALTVCYSCAETFWFSSESGYTERHMHYGNLHKFK